MKECGQTSVIAECLEYAEHVQMMLDRTCCCLLTPMTLASGGSPMFPIVVHQAVSPSIWSAVQSLRRGLSTNPGVTMWVQLKRWCVSCVWMLQRGHSGDGCVLASTLCR